MAMTIKPDRASRLAQKSAPITSRALILPAIMLLVMGATSCRQAWALVGQGNAVSLPQATVSAPLTEEDIDSQNDKEDAKNWVDSDFTGFIDHRLRLQPPDQAMLDKGLRFVMGDDFPPFESRADDGTPKGYDVDLARALCEVLSMACTIKILPFDQIPDYLAQGKADAALAGLRPHTDLNDKVAFSRPYLQMPARFVCRKDYPFDIETLLEKGDPIALEAGSAHEAFFRAYFPQINPVPVADLTMARQLLVEGKVKAIFTDAIRALPMVSGVQSPLAFSGKPYYDAHFFGEGLSIAYYDAQENEGGQEIESSQAKLGNLLDYGLLLLSQKGHLFEIYARHFPVDIYAGE